MYYTACHLLNAGARHTCRLLIVLLNASKIACLCNVTYWHRVQPTAFLLLKSAQECATWLWLVGWHEGMDTPKVLEWKHRWWQSCWPMGLLDAVPSSQWGPCLQWSTAF